MIKQKTVIEVIKDERVYQLSVSPESPLGEVYDVLNQMRNYIIDRIEQERKAQSEATEEAEAVESSED